VVFGGQHIILVVFVARMHEAEEKIGQECNTKRQKG
jgi:hypothetical protein